MATAELRRQRAAGKRSPARPGSRRGVGPRAPAPGVERQARRRRRSGHRPTVVAAVALLLALAACAGPGGDPTTAAVAADPAGASHPDRPHIVLIVADDLGAHDLSCTGSPALRTPRLDGLAAAGLRFTTAYADAANCAPSRAALLSGMAAPRTGVHTVGSSARGQARDRRLVPLPNRTDLPDEAVTLAEALAAGGYATASIGKWHLGDDPTTQGFEHALAGTAAGHPRSYLSPYRNPALTDGPDGEHLSDRLVDEALAWLARDDERPRFLYLPFYAVHTPIQPRPDLAASWEAALAGRDDVHAGYAALVAGLDEAVGHLLDGLDTLGLAEDTLVVFVSDNGGHLGYTSNAPLRAGKGSFHEGGLRVPLILRWPGRVAAGRVEHVPVRASDLYPTLLRAADLPLPDQPCDAVDLTDLLRDDLLPGEGSAQAASPTPAGTGGRTAHTQDPAGREDGVAPPATGDLVAARQAAARQHLATRPLAWHFPAYLERYRASPPGPWRTPPVGVLRAGRFKLMEWFEDGALSLFDLDADPGETTDLAGTRPELAAALQRDLAAWRGSVGAVVPSEPEPRYRPPDVSPD